jgi:hypothetical protein
MPTNTKVHKMAKAMEKEGVPVGEAIATAQKRTGKSYATGNPPKSKAKKPKRGGKR